MIICLFIIRESKTFIQIKLKISTMSTKRNDYVTYFNKLFRNFQLNDLNEFKRSKNIRSLREYARYFEIPYPSFRLKIIKYLDNEFGVKKSFEIRSQLWPSTHLDARLKKYKLKEEIINQLVNFYPENNIKIKTLSDLAFKWNLNRLTITEWIKDWLIQEYGRFEGKNILYDVWTSKKNRNNPISYNAIKKYIKNKNGYIITKEEIFNSMKERPTKRYIKIKCNKNHKNWTARVGHLIYDDTWCPICQQRKCQEITTFYMNNVFNLNFKSEISIREACGCSGKVLKTIELNNKSFKFIISAGKLRFDGYNGKIKLKGQDNKYYSFKVAFEYDGIQHDNFTSLFHKSFSEFANQIARDKLELEIAEKYKIILIRIKEYDGFNWKFLLNNPIRVQKEIIKKFYEKVEKFYHINHEIVKISPILDLRYINSDDHQVSIDNFV